MEFKYNVGTIWISGITSSGKTTLGKRLYQNLLAVEGANIDFLDGDEIRKLLGPYGHSIEDRFAMLEDVVALALESNNKGNIVILSSVGHKKKMREYARSKIPYFMEIFLNCPSNVCVERDYKGLYKKALAGEYETFAGVTEPYEMSDKPELILNTDQMSQENCSQVLLQNVLNFFKK